MREIKFRGKRCSDGEWVYGSYLESNRSWAGHKPHKSWIVCSAFSNGGWLSLMGRYAVKDDTIGQYTGVCDAKDNPIYEGDILATSPIKNDFLHIVRFSDDKLRFDCIERHHYINNPSFGGIALDHSWMKELNKVVIGNIYDNPELLESKS